MSGGVLPIAHRGASGIAPENTKIAFVMALDLGARAIEFDVQLTRDNVVIVFHDQKVLAGTPAGRWGQRMGDGAVVDAMTGAIVDVAKETVADQEKEKKEDEEKKKKAEEKEKARALPAFELADRIAIMNEGRLQQVGTPREIYDRPANRFVADFVGSANFLDATVIGREQQADLIIIGTHGYTGLKHVLLGSVAERVVRTAPCPVLVVR